MEKIKAEYFTDPLCSWSWGNEPKYRKLREEFGDQIQWRHRLGGLMERWSKDFYDPLYKLSGGDGEALAKHQEEVSVVCDISYEEATDALKKLRDASIVRKRPVGHFCMWELIN